MMIAKQKRGQSEVITTILLILIVLGAIIIVWNVIRPLITKTSEKIGTEAITTQLEITEAKLWVTGGAQVKVKRGVGEGDITSLKFVFEKQDGTTEVTERKGTDEMPDELETKVYDFTPEEINEKIEKVSVAPMFGNNMGIEVSESESKIKKDSSGKRIADVDLPQEIINNISLVSWWKFDETSGTTAWDSVDGNNGTLVNGPVWTTGQVNGALDFDGVDDYVTFLQIGSFKTISLWTKIQNGALLTSGEWNDNSDYFMHYESGLIKFEQNPAGGPDLTVSGAVNLNQWTHIVVICASGNENLLYKNGVFINKSTNNSPEDCAKLRLGTNHIGADFFNGTIDDFMLFNKTLSAEQINAIYNNQKK